MPKARPSIPPDDAGAVLRRDRDSFHEPLEAARAACLAILDRPVTRVSGAEAQLRQALDDRDALQAFDRAVADHLRQASFHTLPPVRIRGRRIPGFHHLTCGPFRGIFVVGRDRTDVVALLFSRAPHDDILARLGELVLRQPPPADDGDIP